MSLYGLLKSNGPTGFGYNSTAEEVTAGVDLRGRTFLVTGANSGLGTEAVRVLVLRGARVVATGRTEAKVKEACGAFGDQVVPVALELSEPASVRACVAAVRALDVRLDAIIANAGVMALPERTVKHGLELQFLTNHVGHFLLVTGLLDRLTDAGRVVMLSSAAHLRAYPEGIRLDDLDASRGYTAWGAYGQSKLANLLFARHLATRLPASAQTANSVHPGVIATNLTRHMNPVMQAIWSGPGPILALKSIPQGTATEVYVAANPKAGSVNGQYWSDCNVKESSAHGRDDALARALWEKTEAIVARLP
jgi:WW domain-containing oxidoreductase